MQVSRIPHETTRGAPASAAEKTPDRYGWPLQVIEACADDPARDRPDAFLKALRVTLDPGHGGEAAQ